MSIETDISEREAFPVVLGTHTIFADKFKVSVTRHIAEGSNSSGTGFFTAFGYRAVRIEISGRIYDGDNPFGFLIFVNDNTRGTRVFNINYRGMKFTNCYIQHYDFTDSGDECTDVKITLLSMDRIMEVSG